MCNKSINQLLILPSISVPKVPVIFSNLLAASVHLSLLTFHIHFTFISSHHLQLATQFSRHILSNVFNQCFHISTVFQNGPFFLFCLSCHIRIVYNCIVLKSLIKHFVPFSEWSREVSAPHVNVQIPKHSKTEIMSN